MPVCARRPRSAARRAGCRQLPEHSVSGTTRESARGVRALLGKFAMVLPTGAAVSRLAMKLGERWQEGEVVEKQAARRAYEDALHRRQDPALLEQGAGNEITARVFPIPPRAKNSSSRTRSSSSATRRTSCPLSASQALLFITVSCMIAGPWRSSRGALT